MGSPQETGSWLNLGADNFPPLEFSLPEEASVSAAASDFASGTVSASGSSASLRIPRHLTKEQVRFFQHIVDACLSSSPAGRQMGQTILAEDPSVKGLMGLLAPFIYKAMCISIAEEQLKHLIFLLRMINALLENPNLNLDRYIHLMVPGPLGCLLANQISTNPGAEDHWTVRMYANKLIADIVDRYPCIHSAIVEYYVQSLEAEQLETVYGAVIGLGEMGEAAIRQWLVPQVKVIAGRIEPFLVEEMEMSSGSLKTLAAKYITDELLEICGPIMEKLSAEQEEEQDTLTGAFYFLGLAEEAD